jgi:5-methylcytosine-specific restriction endonuclease McrA
MSAPMWKNKRVRLPREEYEKLLLKIFAKQNWRCAICRECKPLQGDHIRKRSQLGGDTEENLQGVCANCHDWLDNRGGKNKMRSENWKNQNIKNT